MVCRWPSWLKAYLASVRLATKRVASFIFVRPPALKTEGEVGPGLSTSSKDGACSTVFKYPQGLEREHAVLSQKYITSLCTQLCNITLTNVYNHCFVSYIQIKEVVRLTRRHLITCNEDECCDIIPEEHRRIYIYIS